MHRTMWMAAVGVLLAAAGLSRADGDTILLGGTAATSASADTQTLKLTPASDADTVATRGFYSYSHTGAFRSGSGAGYYGPVVRGGYGSASGIRVGTGTPYSSAYRYGSVGYRPYAYRPYGY
jgi:hypothetical protein